MLPLLLCPTFFQYAFTAEVFALHVLICVLLLAVSLIEIPWRQRIPLQMIVFGVGAGHHHTVLFLAPVVFFDFRRERFSYWMAWVLAGAGLTVLAYTSLLLRDTASPWSWRRLAGFGDVAFHFLRRDYGTFSLAPLPHRSSAGEVLFHALESMGIPVVVFLVIILLSWRGLGSNLKAKFGVILCSLLGYLVFWTRSSGLSPMGPGGAVLERFYLMPLATLATLAAASKWAGWSSRPLVRNAIHLLVVAGCLFNSGELKGRFERMHDSILDTLSARILEDSVKLGRPSFILVASDSLFMNLRLQAYLEKVPEVGILSLGLMCSRWHLEKSQADGVRLDADMACRSPDRSQFQALVAGQNWQGIMIFVDGTLEGVSGRESHVLPYGIGYGEHITQAILDRIAPVRIQQAYPASWSYDQYLVLQMMSVKGDLLIARREYQQKMYNSSLKRALTIAQKFPAHFGAREIYCRSLLALQKFVEGTDCINQLDRDSKALYPYFLDRWNSL